MAVSYVAARAPPGFDVSAQAVVSTLMAAGVSVGTALGGVVMQVFGSRVLYAGAAVTIAAVTALFGAQSARGVTGAKGRVIGDERSGLVS